MMAGPDAFWIYNYRICLFLCQDWYSLFLLVLGQLTLLTEIANKAGQLTLQDVNSCYDKEFHSSQGSSGSSTSGGK
jgi:hypothetical protein